MVRSIKEPHEQIQIHAEEGSPNLWAYLTWPGPGILVDFIMASEQIVKVCSKCRTPKQLSKFNQAEYGVRGDCKLCVRLKNQALYQKNLKANRKRSLDYYYDHREEKANISKETHHRHVESLNRNYILELIAVEYNLKVSDVPEFVLHLKTQQLIFTRLLKTLLKKVSHGTN